MCCGTEIHLGPDGAARAFEALGGAIREAGLMMPIHWGLFDLALHAWRQPMERLLELAGEKGIQAVGSGAGAAYGGGGGGGGAVGLVAVMVAG